jgi:hypothetical protein
MFWNSPGAPLLTSWQAEVELAQEAGDTPLLGTNDGPPLLASLSQTPAAQAFLKQRADTAAPVVLAGGLGLAWLNLLLFDSGNRRAVGASTLFSGCDDACRMASYATAVAAVSPLRAAPGEAPAGAVDLLTPQARPGASSSWDALAMWALADDQGWEHADGQSLPGDFQAWMAGGLIFFMIAVSLLAGALINAAPGV